MANRYLVDTGNWNDTSIWSATSGGSPGASVPTELDNVFINTANEVSLVADISGDLLGSINISNESAVFNVTTYKVNTGGFSISAGTVNITDGEIKCFDFSAFGTGEKIVNMGSGTLIIDDPWETGFTVGSASHGSFTFNAMASTVIFNQRDQWDPMVISTQVEFNNVVINLIASGTNTQIYNSPKFRSLIIQSKNSNAHTIELFSGITVGKFIGIGSSSSNKLTITGDNEFGPIPIYFMEEGTSYGQFLHMDEVYPDYIDDPIVPYIGTNSTQQSSLGWVLQVPPKISTLVDDLSVGPSTNTNWRVSKYAKDVADLATLFEEIEYTAHKAYYMGTTYNFGIDGTEQDVFGMSSAETFDFTESEVVIEVGAPTGEPQGTIFISEISRLILDFDSSSVHEKSALRIDWSMSEAPVPDMPDDYVNYKSQYYYSLFEDITFIGRSDSKSNSVTPSSFPSWLKFRISGNSIYTSVSSDGSSFSTEEEMVISDEELLSLKSCRLNFYPTADSAQLRSINVIPPEVSERNAKVSGKDTSNGEKNAKLTAKSAPSTLNTGWVSPGTIINDDSFGFSEWANPENAVASDDTYASINGFGSGSGEEDTVAFAGLVDSSGSFGGGDNKSSQAGLSGNNSYSVYGGNSDLWSDTWSASDVNNSNFGFAYQIAHTSPGPTTFSHYLKATNFNLSVPSDATIVGIEARVESFSTIPGSGGMLVDHIQIRVHYNLNAPIFDDFETAGTMSTTSSGSIKWLTNTADVVRSDSFVINGSYSASKETVDNGQSAQFTLQNNTYAIGTDLITPIIQFNACQFNYDATVASAAGGSVDFLGIDSNNCYRVRVVNDYGFPDVVYHRLYRVVSGVETEIDGSDSDGSFKSIKIYADGTNVKVELYSDFNYLNLYRILEASDSTYDSDSSYLRINVNEVTGAASPTWLGLTLDDVGLSAITGDPADSERDSKISGIDTTSSEKNVRLSSKETISSNKQTKVSGQAGDIFSKEFLLSLPAGHEPLDVRYTTQEVTDVLLDDGVYVNLKNDNEGYFIHQYRKHNYLGTNTDIIDVLWKGKSSIVASATQQTVYLQIYNYNDSIWETLDQDNTTMAGIPMTLSGSVSENFSDYYDENNSVTIRVYQRYYDGPPPVDP